jgi:hypothetical protein
MNDVSAGATDTLAELVAQEQSRRERAWCPADRWRALQETIRWAELQPTARRNTPGACLARERRLLRERGSEHEQAAS